MKKLLLCLFLSFSLLTLTIPALAASDDAAGERAGEDGYLPYDEFMALYGDDYSVSVMSVQTSPNTPITSANGLKGILIKLFGFYDPPVTQLRYQSNTNTNYTYVNDIQPDYPWMISAAIFAIVLFCLFKMGGALFCKR